MKVAVLGPKGTFSDKATEKFGIKKEDVIYSNTIAECFKLIDDNTKAIIPFENTLDGYVQESLDYMLYYNAKIIKECFIPVQFAFVGNENSMDNIDIIYVQFKAKGQCQNFLNNYPSKKIIITESNMESLEMAKKSKSHTGAIIPTHAISKDFAIIIDNVTDSKNNETRFLYIDNEIHEYDKKTCNKASIVVTSLVDKPGLLYNCLKTFKDYDLSLISLMSRPTKESIGKYHFFIEINGNNHDELTIKKAIDEIKSDEVNTVILGMY